MNYALVLGLFLSALLGNASNAIGQSLLSHQTPEIQQIWLNETGVCRGLAFGTPRKAVLAAEKLKLDAEGKDFLAYKLELNDKEYVEIIYTFDEKDALNYITLAFIENINLKREEQIVDDFEHYFNARFGQFTVNSLGMDRWESKDGFVIEMGDASEGGDLLEIEIEIYPVK